MDEARRLNQAYYQNRASEFAERSWGLDLSALHQKFLSLLPAPPATLIDAGCGAGRDSAFFASQGFSVFAFDASPAMVAEARRRTGLTIHQGRFESISLPSAVAGIWASASLLHLPFEEQPALIRRFADALALGGILYLSFKAGEGRRVDGPRVFFDHSPGSLRRLLEGEARLEIIEIWQEESLVRGQAQSWVNALARRGEVEEESKRGSESAGSRARADLASRR